MVHANTKSLPVTYFHWEQTSLLVNDETNLREKRGVWSSYYFKAVAEARGTASWVYRWIMWKQFRGLT